MVTSNILQATTRVQWQHGDILWLQLEIQLKNKNVDADLKPKYVHFHSYILENINVYFLKSVESQDVFFLSYTYKTTLDSRSGSCFMPASSSNVAENSHQKRGGKTPKNHTAPSYWLIHWTMMVWKVSSLHLDANALFSTVGLRGRLDLVQGTGFSFRMNVFWSLVGSHGWARSWGHDGLDHFMVMVFSEFPNHGRLDFV